jgi:hypothetical protein
VPGDDFIWSTMLQELARNVYAYCADPAADRRGMLHVQWSEKEIESETWWLLLIGGNWPFYQALEKQYRDEIGSDPRKLLKRVEAIADRPGVRYGFERRGSFGFGLYFLTQLASLLGIGAGLRLIEPDANLPATIFSSGKFVQPDAEDFAKLSRLPLTMVFWWRVPKGE